MSIGLARPSGRPIIRRILFRKIFENQGLLDRLETRGTMSGKSQWSARDFLELQAGVAQLAEHNVANVVVVGSNPITRSFVVLEKMFCVQIRCTSD